MICSPPSLDNVLPVTVVAHVLGFLSLQDAANATATSRKMRHEIPATDHDGPSTSNMIFISTVQAMTKPSVPTVFRNVRTIAFFGQGVFLAKDPAFAVFLVPFLGRFPHLEVVKFNDLLKARVAIYLELPTNQGEDYDCELLGNPIERVVSTICDGYVSGHLAETVKMEGLICPWRHHPNEEWCSLCHKVASTFPLKQLVCQLLTTDMDGATSQEKKNGLGLTFHQGPSLVVNNERPLLDGWMLEVIHDRIPQLATSTTASNDDG
jgi:hypothetical protein